MNYSATFSFHLTVLEIYESANRSHGTINSRKLIFPLLSGLFLLCAPLERVVTTVSF